MNSTCCRRSLKLGEKEVLGGAAGPSILLVTQGGAQIRANGKPHELKEGHALFVAHDAQLQLEAGSNGLPMHTAIVDGLCKVDTVYSDR